MTENNSNNIRLDHVSQHVYLQHESVMGRTRPRVVDTSFDGSQSRASQPSAFTSRSCLSKRSTSRGHVSILPEAPAHETNQEEVACVDASVDEYP